MKAEIEINAHYHDGNFKTYPCGIADWWGEEICRKIYFDDEIKKIEFIEGEYKVTITLEKINQ